jgi:hypothetical protein
MDIPKESVDNGKLLTAVDSVVVFLEKELVKDVSSISGQQPYIEELGEGGSGSVQQPRIKESDAEASSISKQESYIEDLQQLYIKELGEGEESSASEQQPSQTLTSSTASSLLASTEKVDKGRA